MGTKGWHKRGYLPHYDGWEISQHVIFRLFDSLPTEEQEGDDILDRHMGSSFMRDPMLARAVAETILHNDGEHHRLQAWCVMPNHVHVLLATGPTQDIGSTVRRWKTFSAKRINQHLNRIGSVWARDYFDRFIRDDAHYETTKRYIEMNPVTAGLCDKREAWPFSSVGWESTNA